MQDPLLNPLNPGHLCFNYGTSNSLAWVVQILREVLGPGGENELILELWRSGASSDSRFHEIPLDPVAEPKELTVAVQGITSQSTEKSFSSTNWI